MAPEPAVHRCQPALGLQLAHGQVLEDALLHVSKPSWSASRMRDASAMSSRSSDSVPQGISSTVSSQVRIQPVSGLWSLVRSSLSTSRSTALRTCSGRSRASSLAR